MDHAAMKDKVFALYDGELGQEARQEVEAHLKGCLECRAMYERWRTTARAFFKEPRPVPSEFFVQRVMDRIELWERPLPAPGPYARLRWLVPALGLAAVLFAMMRPAQTQQPVSVEMLLLEGTPGPASWVLSNATPNTDQMLGFAMEGEG